MTNSSRVAVLKSVEVLSSGISMESAPKVFDTISRGAELLTIGSTSGKRHGKYATDRKLCRS